MKQVLFIIAMACCLAASAQVMDRQETIAPFLAERKAQLITAPCNFNISEHTVAENIRSYFLEVLPELKNPDCDLRLKSEKSSPLGFHYVFVQTYAGKEVWCSELKVSTDKQYHLISAFNGLFSLPETEAVCTDLWYYDGKSLQPAFKERKDHFILLRNLDGQIIYKEDLNKYVMPPDTIVQLRVFMPDPLTSAGVAYGSPYVDSNDVDIPQLNSQRQIVFERVNLSNDTFRLINRYFKYEEFSSPVTVPAFSKTPSFNFTRSEAEFEDVNSYYHLETYRKHIDSLGYPHLIYDSMLVDAHALGTSDLSMYSTYNGKPALYLGEGGVDDGEDADVIIHEYTHSIIEKAATTTNLSNERKAIDEAVCDYMAITYSKRINTFNWKRVFNWDGNNSSIAWFGRDAASSKTYPYNTSQNYYWNTEIFLGALADLDDKIGDSLTERILFGSLPFMSMTMTMKQLALVMLQTDSILYSSQHQYPVQLAFYGRKILDSITSVKNMLSVAEIEVLNSSGFASGASDLIIKYEGAKEVSLSCHDLLGRKLFTDKIFSREARLSPEQFLAGVYILTMKVNGNTYPLKVVRY